MATEEIDVRWAGGETDIEAALAVREQVFCEEQGVPREEEADARDQDALHVVAVDSAAARVVGTLRLLIDGSTAKVGRVAVEAPWRRRGIASRMLELALLDARCRGCVEARLAAQVQATELYMHAGFAVESDVFDDAGMPHVWMGMRLDAES
jgi:predicted GNAT family N-acyltransferase